MKTSELTKAALDWAVCEATGLFAAYPSVKKNFARIHKKGTAKYIYPSTDWSQGGPIIEREKIALVYVTEDDIEDWEGAHPNGHTDFGPTPLIAAMRCYVASKLGEEVDVPEELRGDK